MRASLITDEASVESYRAFPPFAPPSQAHFPGTRRRNPTACGSLWYAPTRSTSLAHRFFMLALLYAKEPGFVKRFFGGAEQIPRKGNGLQYRKRLIKNETVYFIRCRIEPSAANSILCIHCVRGTERTEIGFIQCRFAVVDHNRAAFSVADVAGLTVDFLVNAVIPHGDCCGDRYEMQTGGQHSGLKENSHQMDRFPGHYPRNLALCRRDGPDDIAAQHPCPQVLRCRR